VSLEWREWQYPGHGGFTSGNNYRKAVSIRELLNSYIDLKQRADLLEELENSSQHAKRW